MPNPHIVENGRDESQYYPDIFPVSLTHSEFPSTAIAMAEMGVPFGAVVRPFIKWKDRRELKNKAIKYLDPAWKIARCSVCYGYINPYCDITSARWFCSLCGARNSLPKSMSRYRHPELKLLPEMQNLMLDYPLTMTSDVHYGAFDSIPVNDMLQTPARRAPLVHVFLIQESMTESDEMQAVVEGLTKTIRDLHPDIHVLLLTFSNRIGIVRVPLDSDILRDDADSKEMSSAYSIEPTIQYIQFSLNDLYGTQSSRESTNSSFSNAFEGNFMHELSSTNGENWENILNTSSQGDERVTVAPIIPLGLACYFMDAIVRVGDARH
jgi:hypothetical protein